MIYPMKALLLICSLSVLILLSGCTSTRSYSTYRQWKDKQEVKTQAKKMLKAAEGVTFKGTKKD